MPLSETSMVILMPGKFKFYFFFRFTVYELWLEYFELHYILKLKFTSICPISITLFSECKNELNFFDVTFHEIKIIGIYKIWFCFSWIDQQICLLFLCRVYVGRQWESVNSTVMHFYWDGDGYFMHEYCQQFSPLFIDGDARKWNDCFDRGLSYFRLSSGVPLSMQIQSSFSRLFSSRFSLLPLYECIFSENVNFLWAPVRDALNIATLWKVQIYSRTKCSSFC